jgi:hypothetical protein
MGNQVYQSGLNGGCRHMPLLADASTLPTYLTDNQTLEKVAASRRIDHPLLQWDTRNTMDSFFNIISSQPSQVFHIKRS